MGCAVEAHHPADDSEDSVGVADALVFGPAVRPQPMPERQIATSRAKVFASNPVLGDTNRLPPI